jgi:glycosyltransferase involved in cell wall biosynthesis
LRNQMWEKNHGIEVLVIDNNSSDNTEKVVASFQPGWPLGELRYLHESKQGKQFALNHAIRNAKADILVFTDDDVVLSANWLQKIVEATSDTTIDLIGGKTLLIWPDGKPPPWFHPSMLAVVAGVDLGEKRLNSPPDDYAPAGTNMIVRRTLFDRVGYFSESHYRHMDYEFGIRAMHAGANVVYDPALVVYTHVPAGTLNKKYFLRWYFKLGIAEAMHSNDHSQRLFGLPRWIWRQLANDFLLVIWNFLRFRLNILFKYEVHVSQRIGYIVAIWHQRLWPNTHQQWVERWSQKHGVKFS